MIALLDAGERETVFTACGVLINLMIDEQIKPKLKEEDGIKKWVLIKKTPSMLFHVEAANLQARHIFGWRCASKLRLEAWNNVSLKFTPNDLISISNLNVKNIWKFSVSVLPGHFVINTVVMLLKILECIFTLKIREKSSNNVSMSSWHHDHWQNNKFSFFSHFSFTLSFLDWWMCCVTLASMIGSYQVWFVKSFGTIGRSFEIYLGLFCVMF